MENKSSNSTDKIEKPSNSNVRNLGVLLLVISCIFMFVFYFQVKSLQKDPIKEGEKKIALLVQMVGQIIDLPQGELPSVAEVSDLKPLAGKAFFANAKIGDQVLLYTIAQKAYLYDPKAHMILEVASLNTGK